MFLQKLEKKTRTHTKSLIYESIILVKNIAKCHYLIYFKYFLFNSITTAAACLGLFTFVKLQSLMSHVYSTRYNVLTDRFG